MGKIREQKEKYEQQEEIIISNPEVVPILFHEKKGSILKMLIDKEMTIIDIKNKTGMNPGTIKRHITDLLKHNLIFISREKINDYSILMKFYRARAKKFIIKITWPR